MAYLRTLGSFQLEGSEFTRPKPLLMLCYVALEGSQVRRHIAELFWPEARDSMKSLTVALARLRKGAPGVIEASHERLWSHIAVDAKNLLNLLDKGEITTALELYQAPFLDGFFLHNWGNELEEWVYRTREFLSGYLSRSLLNSAENAASRGHYSAAAKLAEAVCNVTDTSMLEPTELNRLHTLLIAAESPHSISIAKEAEAFGPALAQSPQEAKTLLKERLDLISDIPHNLPQRRTSFIGRDLDLIQLVTFLEDPKHRCVTLLGSAGVGKTRLALEVAYKLHRSGRFTGGVYRVALESVTASEHIPATLATTLNLEYQEGEFTLEKVKTIIGQQAVLLVFDNAEHLVEGASIFSELLASCLKLSLLVTSRERLNIEEEHVVPVAGLLFPQNEPSLSEASHYDAVRLFVERGKGARLDFTLTQDNLAAVLHICHLVEGLALGLELAAAWLRIMPPAEIAHEISRHLKFLTTHLRNIPKRHRSLQSAYESSWTRLSSKEQTVLRRLSVFRGGFQREAASAVTVATLPILASLVDKSLLRVDTSGRYDQHPLLYQFTQEKLVHHSDDWTAINSAHANYYLGFTESLRPQLLQPTQDGESEAIRALTREQENLRAALGWSAQYNPQLTLQLACALQSYWEIRGYLAEGCNWLGRALKDSHQNVSAELRIRALLAHGRFLLLSGKQSHAVTAFETALDLAEAAGQSRQMAEASNHLGLLALERGDYEDATSYCKNSLDLHRQLNNQRGIAVTHNNLGNIARAQKRWSEAEVHYNESLALHQRLGIQRSKAIALANLGFVARQQGKLQRATKLLQESLHIRQSLGDEIGLAHSLLGLAGVMTEFKHPKQAVFLLGATDKLLKATQVELAQVDRLEYQYVFQICHNQLSPEMFSTTWERGYASSRKTVLNDTLQLSDTVLSPNE